MVLHLDILPNRSTGHPFIKAINDIFLLLPYILYFKVEGVLAISERFRRLGIPDQHVQRLAPYTAYKFFQTVFW